MARGRMISKCLSTSEKYAALATAAGDLAEFCQALYPLLVVHTDDFGRLQGDPFTVKSLCYPASPRRLEEFEQALFQLERVDLIRWYTVGHKAYIQILQFDAHQSGLHKRTQSHFPEIPGNSGKFPPKRREGKGTEEKRTEEKGSTPLPPFCKGGRLTRQELKDAREVRTRAMSRCPHAPRCTSFDACVRAIALERRTGAE